MRGVRLLPTLASSNMSTLDVIEVWWHSIRQARSGTHYIPTGMLVCRSNVPIRSIALDHVTYPGSYRVSYELAWLSAATYHSFCRYHLHASFVVGTTFQQVASSGNNGANYSKTGTEAATRNVIVQSSDKPWMLLQLSPRELSSGFAVSCC